MIWGGLNGIGILGFKIWRHFRQGLRSVVAGLVFVIFLVCNRLWPAPVLNIFMVWSGIFFAGTLIRAIYTAIFPNRDVQWLNFSWNVLMTFVFISFTRLFFRSGSNLDPAVANETAWNTAKNMIASIGGQWNVSVIPDILHNYWHIYLLGEDGRLLDFEQLDIIQHLAALQHGEGRADVVDLVQLVAQVRQLGAVGVVVDNGGGGLHQVEFRTQRVGIRAKRQVQQIMPP